MSVTTLSRVRTELVCDGCGNTKTFETDHSPLRLPDPWRSFRVDIEELLVPGDSEPRYERVDEIAVDSNSCAQAAVMKLIDQKWR